MVVLLQRITLKKQNLKRSRTSVFQKAEVLKLKTCVEANGFIKGYGIFEPESSLEFLGLNAVLAFPGASGKATVHLKAMFGHQLSRQTY